jgi:hypothetical protein
MNKKGQQKRRVLCWVVYLQQLALQVLLLLLDVLLLQARNSQFKRRMSNAAGYGYWRVQFKLLDLGSNPYSIHTARASGFSAPP